MSQVKYTPACQLTEKTEKQIGIFCHFPADAVITSKATNPRTLVVLAGNIKKSRRGHHHRSVNQYGFTVQLIELILLVSRSKIDQHNSAVSIGKYFCCEVETPYSEGKLLSQFLLSCMAEQNLDFRHQCVIDKSFAVCRMTLHIRITGMREQPIKD